MRLRGLQIAGALLAAGTVLAAWVLPRPAAEPAAGLATAPAVAEWSPGSPATPAPQAPKVPKVPEAKPVPADRVENVLAREMPDVHPSERMRLARAILEESRFAAIDPLLVLALIAVESGFDQGAESVRGARGLMQLRATTFEAEAERSNLEGDLDDPVTNVRAGVRYYRRLLRAFGSHERALMAYNAGPNRILRYLREDGEIPERFQEYPRKVNEELSKLKKTALRRAVARPGTVLEPIAEASPLPRT